MTFPTDSLRIEDGKLIMSSEVREMVEDVTGDCPSDGDPLNLVCYLEVEQCKLAGESTTQQGQLGRILCAELEHLKVAIQELLGGRTNPLVH